MRARLSTQKGTPPLLANALHTTGANMQAKTLTGSTLGKVNTGIGFVDNIVNGVINTYNTGVEAESQQQQQNEKTFFEKHWGYFVAGGVVLLLMLKKK